MNATNAIDFKREHPHNYWVRIVCLAFCLVFLALWAMGDAEAIGHYPIADEDYAYPTVAGRTRSTHTKDDTLVWGWTPHGDSIVVTYKEVGEPWTNYTIETDGDDNYYKFGGVINTENNTVVLHFGAKHAAAASTWIAIKWPGSDWDTWTTVEMGYNRYPMDLSVNDTGILGILNCVTSSAYSMYFHYYDLETLTKTPDNNDGTYTGGATGHYSYGHIMVNMSGDFFFGFSSGSQGYYSDFGGELAIITVTGSNYIPFYWGALENDTFFCVGQYLNTGRPFIYYTDDYLDVAWTKTWIEEVGSGCTYESGGIHASVKQNSTEITVVTYCNTHEEVVTWTRDYASTELQWESARSETGISDPDDIGFMGGFGGLFPMHVSTGIRWTRPQSGWALFARNESGATDTFDLWYDSIVFTVDLTTDDPEVYTLALPDATYDVFYEHTLTKTGGTVPFVWSILIKPSWMSIGADNGTIYGTPDGTGTEEVRVKLADGVPRYDEKQWTLTIGTGSEGGEGDEDGGGICATGWIFFAVIALIIIVFIGWTADTML